MKSTVKRQKVHALGRMRRTPCLATAGIAGKSPPCTSGARVAGRIGDKSAFAGSLEKTAQTTHRRKPVLSTAFPAPQSRGGHRFVPLIHRIRTPIYIYIFYLNKNCKQQGQAAPRRRFTVRLRPRGTAGPRLRASARRPLAGHPAVTGRQFGCDAGLQRDSRPLRPCASPGGTCLR